MPEWLKPAVNKFVLSNTFLSQIFFAKENTEDNTIPTAYTSVKKRGFNKEFMLKHPLEEQVAILAHEVLHDIFEHMDRVGSRDRMLFNMAADYEINRIIQEEINKNKSAMKLPASALIDPKYDHEWSAERIYDDLMNNATKVTVTFKNGDGTGMDIDFEAEGSNGEKLSDAEKQAAKEAIKNAVAQAYALTKQFGSLSAGLDRYVQEILYPKQKWFDILRNYFTSMDWADYDWTKINQREFSKSGLIMPKLYSEELANVLIAVDCSGSIGGPQLAEFQGHINNILSECHPKNTTVAYFDTQVLHVDQYDKYGYPIELKPKGGGGTDFRWLSDYNDKSIDVCVFLTDGYGAFPERGSVTFPVIWCLNHNETLDIPFGDVLNMEN